MTAVREKRHGYDAVIVGAGLAGLSAGLAAARRGKRVVVLEQHSRPGGLVSSFRRGDFRFESGAQCLSSAGMVFPILKALGLAGAVRFVPVSFGLAVGGDRVSVTSEESAIEGLGRLFPGSRDDLARYFERLRPLYRVMALMSRTDLVTRLLPGYLTLGLGLAARPSLLLSLVRERRTTSDDVLQATIRNEELRHVIRNLGYPGMSSSFAAGLWYAVFEDYWFPVGGMGAVSGALAEALAAAGGELRLGARVRTVLLDPGGRAAGVRLETGESVPARVVVWAADKTSAYDAVEPPATVGRARALAAYRARLAAGVPCETFVAVFLGLRMTAEETERLEFSTSYFEHPLSPLLSVTVTSRVDPGAAPSGHASAAVHEFARYEDWARLAGERDGPRDPAYRRAKEEVADRVVRAVARLLPGLDRRVVVREVATPLTYERHTGNRAGASAGWSWDPAHPRVPGVTGPVPGLLTAGHWSYPIGGIPTALAAGYAVGRRIG